MCPHPAAQGCAGCSNAMRRRPRARARIMRGCNPPPTPQAKSCGDAGLLDRLEGKARIAGLQQRLADALAAEGGLGGQAWRGREGRAGAGAAGVLWRRQTAAGAVDGRAGLEDPVPAPPSTAAAGVACTKHALSILWGGLTHARTPPRSPIPCSRGRAGGQREAGGAGGRGGGAAGGPQAAGGAVQRLRGAGAGGGAFSSVPWLASCMPLGPAQLSGPSQAPCAAAGKLGWILAGLRHPPHPLPPCPSPPSTGRCAWRWCTWPTLGTGPTCASCGTWR